jgi:guanylate kinase
MNELVEMKPGKPEPLLVVISGPSGVGKDSVLHLLKQQPGLQFVVTATTRAPRQGEQEGVDYHFVSQERFAEMIEADELLEYALVYNDYKGIPRSHVNAALQSGKDVVLRIDVQGARTIRGLYPDALLIFLTVDDEEELIKRLAKRSSEDDASRKLRLAMIRKEFDRIPEFDYVVPNREGQLARTVEIILSIIQAEHHRVEPRKVLV